MPRLLLASRRAGPRQVGNDARIVQTGELTIDGQHVNWGRRPYGLESGNSRETRGRRAPGYAPVPANSQYPSILR